MLWINSYLVYVNEENNLTKWSNDNATNIDIGSPVMEIWALKNAVLATTVDNAFKIVFLEDDSVLDITDEVNKIGNIKHISTFNREISFWNDTECHTFFLSCKSVRKFSMQQYFDTIRNIYHWKHFLYTVTANNKIFCNKTIDPFEFDRAAEIVQIVSTMNHIWLLLINGDVYCSGKSNIHLVKLSVNNICKLSCSNKYDILMLSNTGDLLCRDEVIVKNVNDVIVTINKFIITKCDGIYVYSFRLLGNCINYPKLCTTVSCPSPIKKVIFEEPFVYVFAENKQIYELNTENLEHCTKNELRKLNCPNVRISSTYKKSARKVHCE